MGGSESQPAKEGVVDSPPANQLIVEKIYILRLVDGKYYIGRTMDVNKRFNEHFNGTEGKGAEWTKKYKVIEIIETKDSTSPFDEDKYVLEYMNRYGVENVRGGSYANIQLTKEQINSVERMLRGGNNECYKCGAADHFIKDCTQKAKYCTRCGRYNHNSTECFATTHFDGRTLVPLPTESFEEITLKEKEDAKYESVDELTNPQDKQLFVALKKWRYGLAQQLNIKSYQIFTDATLTDIAFYKPTNLENAIRIKGIGPKKVEQYGAAILDLIKTNIK